MSLRDRVAIVTGGAQGIGKAIALSLAEAGANVVIAEIERERAEGVAEEIRSLGREALVCQTDVVNMSEVEEMVGKALDKFKRVDILINNVGIVRDSLLVRMKEEDWDKVLEVNLKGAFNCTRAVAKVMMRQRSGKIISISSVVGITGNIGQANYAASKAGLIGFTKSTARELSSRGITVNCVAPGFIRTPMTERLDKKRREEAIAEIPLGRFGEASDVARVVLFLSSDESSYITGQVINVDGGMVM